jgi:hypothetical protein
MQRYVWTHLTRQQIGAYAEYFVKMELTMYGFQVYSSEVDDRGIDFVARYGDGPSIEVQVKSLRTGGYVFMPKQKFNLAEHRYLALARFSEEKPPDLYLVPSLVWATRSDAASKIFVSRDYEGLKSDPEWGLNVSRKNAPALQPFRFENTVESLTKGIVIGS